MSKKKVLVDIDTNNKYYEFIEKLRAERELSFTACVKHLLFDRIDDLLDKETQLLNQEKIAKVINENISNDEEKVEEKPKKDMLKNLRKIKDK